MAKMKREDLEQIIARDLPGYKVARQSKVEREAEPATRSASPRDLADGGSGGGGSDHLAELRRKYLGVAADDEEDDDVQGAADTAGSNPGYHTDASAADDDEEEIVAVEPETSNHPWDRSARPKAVVVKNKKVIGVQG